jgi:hypothetical protein
MRSEIELARARQARELKRESELVEQRRSRTRRESAGQPRGIDPAPAPRAGFRGETDDGIQFE